METTAEIMAQYTPRDMLEALEQNPRPSTFLKDRLVSGAPIEHDTDVIEIDVEKGGQTVAAYVSRVGDANVVGKRGFETNIHAIPYVYEETPFTAKDVRTRLPGETVYKTGAGRRLDVKMGKWMSILSDRLTRLEEKQLAEAIQTGKVVVTGKDVNYTVDFQMDPSHLITNSGADNWGSGTEDKVAQLEAASELIRESGAPTATELYLGFEAGQNFLKDAAILANLDNRRVERGEINIKQLAGQRATFLGTYNGIGLSVDVFSYQAKYQDSAGVSHYYIDTNNAVLGSQEARVNLHYGMIENLNHGSFVGKRFPDVIINPNGRAGAVTMESGPLMGLHQPDGFVRILTKS